MTFPRSSSDDARQASSAFWLLDEQIRRWIWEQGWSELRDVQEHAIRAILHEEGDVVISAATARGKTEAAFLPLCSQLVGRLGAGVRVLYVGPLKALINDQFERLQGLCDRLEIPVHRWHGDVNAAHKKHLLKQPSGIVLITPESLEALFVLRATELPGMFADLGYIVIDELHSFMGNERGRQLQSLLHRLDLLRHCSARRIALSATLGDMARAAEFLRPRPMTPPKIIVSSDASQEVRLQIRGYTADEHEGLQADDHAPAEATPRGPSAIAEHLFAVLRGNDNLVFCNSRNEVETYADLLRCLSEDRRVPNEFLGHHGSMAKAFREDVEARLKDKALPLSVLCTSTLEMGIDIGSVESVAQVGVPPSVASLRQRLGRSGRRGGPAILRVYVRERTALPELPIVDRLRPQLVQAVAMVRLLLEKWYEPPEWGALHLSTLIQQVLSTIAASGGGRAVEIWRALCETGPFDNVDQRMFSLLLRDLASHELIMQSSDGTLLLDLAGERLVNHYSFFAAFTSVEEYRLVAGTQVLGALPIKYPIAVGSYLIFLGRRWQVTHIDPEARVIEVVPSVGGIAPRFEGSGGRAHDRVREEMYRVYMSDEVPTYLDAHAKALLAEGRREFGRLGLERQRIVEDGKRTLFFAWKGDRVMNTVLLQLRAAAMNATRDNLALTIEGVPYSTLRNTLATLVAAGPANSPALAATVGNKRGAKYDYVLGPELLATDYASSALDCEGAWAALRELLEDHPASND